MLHTQCGGMTMKKPKPLKRISKTILKKGTQRYPRSLSSKRWRVIRNLFPYYQGMGRPAKWPIKCILDAILYVLKIGCPWRLLPKDFPPWVEEELGLKLEIVKRNDDVKGFEILPWRWIMERTFAWISRNRRMSKDFERLPETTEVWIDLSMFSMMSNRLESFEKNKKHAERAA